MPATEPPYTPLQRIVRRVLLIEPREMTAVPTGFAYFFFLALA